MRSEKNLPQKKPVPLAPGDVSFSFCITIVISIWFRKVDVMRRMSLTAACSTAAFQSVGENLETTLSLFSREFRKTSTECRCAFRTAHSASMAATYTAASSYRLTRLSYRRCSNTSLQTRKSANMPSTTRDLSSSNSDSMVQITSFLTKDSAFSNKMILCPI